VPAPALVPVLVPVLPLALALLRTQPLCARCWRRARRRA
jgi:hypothetical protein